MIATVTPGSLQGSITAPPSKSAMQRACALALLNNGHTIIHNPGKSDDDLAALEIIKSCKAKVRTSADGSLMISSDGTIDYSNKINCGESGLSLRMFSMIAALSDKEIMVNGSGTLLNRPVDFLHNLFQQLGVKYSSRGRSLPIIIQGPLKVKDILIQADNSSQYLTGLLFAFAKAASEPVTITVNDLVSKQYIDLSLQMLLHFGYNVSHEKYNKFFITPAPTDHRNIIYNVEGDWSNAAFLLIAGAIGNNVTINGLDMHSVQPDRNIIKVLESAGANILIKKDAVTVSGSVLNAFEYDATDSPDLFPPLCVLAANCKGVSRIKGISRLLTKESNRLETLIKMLHDLGIKVINDNNEMIITGGEVKGAMTDGCNDHRIVMASAIAGLKSTGNVIINGAEAVNKSYPEFFKDLEKLGATVSLSE